MPYPILPAVSENSDQQSTASYTPSALDYKENPVSSKNDVSKHVKSLQARLGFARFKMTQGWETSTLLDVEQLWKQKQQKLINELPTPRFTQRDIIDKRVYIPSPGARYAKAKKTKLVRTYSNPINENSSKTKPTLYFHHYNHQQKHTELIESSSSSDGEQNTSRYISSTPPVRNSLEYLSYAIAMTENDPVISSQPLPDISEIEPNLIDELDVGSSTAKNLKASPPPSPVTLAAKAIMMFVNHPQNTQ